MMGSRVAKSTQQVHFDQLDCDDWERVVDAAIRYPAIEPGVAALGV